MDNVTTIALPAIIYFVQKFCRNQYQRTDRTAQQTLQPPIIPTSGNGVQKIGEVSDGRNLQGLEGMIFLL